MPAAVYAYTAPVGGSASGPSSVTASLPTGSVAGDLCFLHFATLIATMAADLSRSAGELD